MQCGGAPGNDIRGVIVFKGPVSERPDRPRLKSVYYWSLRDGSIVQDKCYSENLQVIRSPLTQRRTTLSEWQSAATGAEVTDAAKVTFTIFNLELAFELPAGYKCLGPSCGTGHSPWMQLSDGYVVRFRDASSIKHIGHGKFHITLRSGRELDGSLEARTFSSGSYQVTLTPSLTGIQIQDSNIVEIQESLDRVRSIEFSDAIQFGIMLGAITNADRRLLGLGNEGHFMVKSVEDNSFVYGLLIPNDVILSINNRAIGALADIRSIKRALKSGDRVVFHILRRMSPDGAGWKMRDVTGFLATRL